MSSFQNLPFEESVAGWANHFKLSERTIEVLCENIGVLTLEDLVVIYNDPIIMTEMGNYMKRLDYLKFLKVREETLRFLGGSAHNSGRTPPIPSSGSSDSDHTDSESQSRSLSTETDLANSIIPYIDNPSSDQIDSLDALRSPVETSARFAVPVIAVVEGDEAADGASDIIPNADPVIASAEAILSHHSHGHQHYHNHLLRLRIPQDINEMKAFLLNPASMRRLNCYVRRERGNVYRAHPTYTMFTEEGNHFLMSADKKSGSFIITFHPGEISKRPEIFLCEIKSNFMGTEHQFIDDVHGPRAEIGALFWNTKSTFTDKPRKVEVALPKLTPGNQFIPWIGDEHHRMSLFSLAERKDYAQLEYYRNKPPRWNERLGCYSLNYHGRAKMISVKNFQLVRPGNVDDVLLQFGKFNDERFILDFQYPLSPLQAFCIALTAFEY